ncbi:protein phosphatase CheZ [Paracidovorax cattleyae]|uniref:protein phosphatase CheZ n=1 Tax=Paracidovorax cattleyae TaxID=80868 RepID=UPI001E4F1CD0|nr:protein phosphatase CheZ [Paracidovorax cattleyae]
MDTPDHNAPDSADVHNKIGQLTRQLHDALRELGYAEQLKGSMGELPDAQSRLSYIARLTGEAAEKVLNRVEQAKAQHDFIAEETRRVVASLVKDPVAAVAKGEIMNFLHDVERVTKEADVHLTEIMMAQEEGFNALKFFPAVQAGGLAMLKAWQGPFGDVVFCPTGGIQPSNAADFLALGNVACVGGSWLVPGDALAAGDWAGVTELARAAAALRPAR